MPVTSLSDLRKPVTQEELRALMVQFARSDEMRAIVRDQHRSWRPEVVTKLPVRPPDGYEVYLEVDVAGAYGGPHNWHLRYHAKDTGASKWRPVGAQVPLFSIVDTGLVAETTASASYTDLTTVGPSVAVPLAGEYDCDQRMLASNSGAGVSIIGNIKIGAAATGESMRMQADSAVAGHAWSVGSRRRVTAAAADALKVQYKVSGGTGNFYFRSLSVAPVRVGP